MHSLTLPLRPLTRVAALVGRPCHAGASHSFTAARAVSQPIQARHASILGSLSENRGAYNKRIRRGRGPACGKGKTSGRGHKGQKQHGKVPAGFQGGQTPLEKVKGKRGFVNFFSVDMSLCNLDRLQHWIDQGRIDPGRHITLKELKQTRCVHRIKDGIKLLANDADALRQPIHITVSRASASAIAAVERAGGSVTTRFYTRPSIKRILAGQTHPTLSLMSASASASSTSEPDAAAQSAVAPAEAAASLAAAYPPPSAFRYRLPDASSRRDIEYYRDIAHRGYLSHTVEPGAGPSLFFKTPAQTAAQAEVKTRKKKSGGAGATSANKLF